MYFSMFRFHTRILLLGLLITSPIIYYKVTEITNDYPLEENPLASSGNSLTKGRIFFLETSMKDFLLPRSACSVESAALAHPLTPVYILHLSSTWNTTHPLSVVLANYTNIKFLPFNMHYYFKHTAAEKWINLRLWRKSPFQTEHLSDILRYYLLSKLGGIYLDLDVLVFHSLIQFKNTIGYSTRTSLGGAVMIFDKGHPLLNHLAENIIIQYRPYDYTFNGPALITKTIQEICGDQTSITNVTKNLMYDCSDKAFINIVPRGTFFPIEYTDWRILFLPEKSAQVVVRTLRSYAMHTFNKLSSKHPVQFGTGQPYEIFAKTFCPHVYSFLKSSQNSM